MPAAHKTLYWHLTGGGRVAFAPAAVDGPGAPEDQAAGGAELSPACAPPVPKGARTGLVPEDVRAASAPADGTERTGFLVAGILNLTPDSFSDGAQPSDPDSLLRRADRLLSGGARMLDLGAESTRPGAEDIGHEEEWRRLQGPLGALLALRARAVTQPLAHTPARPLAGRPENGNPSVASRSKNPRQPVNHAAGPCLPFFLSIDTFRADTAAAALEARAPVPGCPPVDVINDISGATFDPGMPAVLAQFRPGFVLCHCPARPAVMQQAPRYENVVDELLAWFTERMNALVKAGLPEENICLDPGIGFGKTSAHALAIFRAMPRLAALGRPLYVGISRKSVIHGLTGLPLEERDAATAALTALLAERGAHIHRVHDAAGAVAALKLVRALNSPEHWHFETALPTGSAGREWRAACLSTGGGERGGSK